MLGATVFSLAVPALAIFEQQIGSETGAVLRTGLAILAGAGVIWVVHTYAPHAHLHGGPEGPKSALGEQTLLVFAITLHNFPEGMSVGIAYGADAATALAVTIGIGLQNVPEGLAVAAALIASGFERGRAFWIALLTGLIEPVGGLLGAMAVSLSHALLPWALAASGGAMLSVLSGEIIPDTHRPGLEQKATLALVAGFVLMMIVDVLVT
jgi:ZIP family zinc transporter